MCMSHSLGHQDPLTLLTGPQGPLYQWVTLLQGPPLHALMSAGLVPTQSSTTCPSSLLDKQTTERRWIPVPHSAEHYSEGGKER